MRSGGQYAGSITLLDVTVDEPGFGWVIVLVPAYNEQDCLAATIAEIEQAAPWADILVIDDASTDSTASLAAAAGADVLRLDHNQGAGAAMGAGYRIAAARGYDVAVRVDADGQHDAFDIPALLAGLRDGADVVVGSRFSGGPGYAIGFARRWAMGRLSAQVTRVTGLQLTDTTSGFRAAGRPAIDLYARQTDPRFLGDTVAALVDAAASGLRVVEIPVRMRARQGGRPSLRPWPAAMGFWRMSRALGRAVPLVTAQSEPAGIRYTIEER